MITTVAAARDSTFHAVRRRLAVLTPGAAPVTAAPSLEQANFGARDAPSVRDAELLESGPPTRPIEPVPTRFAAFLDGAQWSLVAAWLGGVPVVHGTVAAAIRQRQDRRLGTWSGPIVRRALYAPLELLAPDARRALNEEGLEVVDTLQQRDPQSTHPFALQEIAYQAVIGAREGAERELAEQWCAAVGQPLFVDGSIAGSRITARSPHVVGVVKSHQALYGTGDELNALLSLPARHRTRIARVAAPNREPVAGWYLRLRAPEGHDPLWGLVRLEIPHAAGAGRLSERADEVSGWVLSEVLPLAVPDARWDKMVYGIRDCEEFLRAIR